MVKIKRMLSILLSVFFLMSMTAASVSAWENEDCGCGFDEGCDDEGCDFFDNGCGFDEGCDFFDNGCGFDEGFGFFDNGCGFGEGFDVFGIWSTIFGGFF